jgi:glycosyltransferase involved in cell wall biosynthesis
MSRLSFIELPPAPLGQIRWPWEQVSRNLLLPIDDTCNLPRISIITPSYNQGQFIEETIRSVLLQGYPNLEYIIIDGGSNDRSVEIIQKYEKYLAYWVSETDRGQSHALNKGLERATGEIFTFINSDDVLAPGALHRVATYFTESPSCWVLNGGLIQIDRDGLPIREFSLLPSITWEDIALGKTYQPQPGTFWRTNAFLNTGRFREDLHYYFDQEFFIRLLQHYTLETILGPFAYARIHENAKTQKASPDMSREMYGELLNLLPQLKLNPIARLLRYRSFKLNMLKATIPDFGVDLVKKLSLLTQFPILFTSPLYLKSLFTKD